MEKDNSTYRCIYFFHGKPPTFCMQVAAQAFLKPQPKKKPAKVKGSDSKKPPADEKKS